MLILQLFCISVDACYCVISSCMMYLCCDILSQGSLVMRHPGEMSTPTQGSILFGTINGAIGSFFEDIILLISFVLKCNYMVI